MERRLNIESKYAGIGLLLWVCRARSFANFGKGGKALGQSGFNSCERWQSAGGNRDSICSVETGGGGGLV
jgi:hypothetical protein